MLQFVFALFPIYGIIVLISFLARYRYLSDNMAEASAADGKMKDLKISEVKKSKKDGAPAKAAKKPQQQKKKVGLHGYNCMMAVNGLID